VNIIGESQRAAPLVSVGVPVWNREKLIRDAIESVLAQDYPNLEVIISDNDSSDGTGAICEEYAARDPRIRYHRCPQNMGMNRNFLRVLERARGKYFTWLASDDVLSHNNYLSAVVNFMESHGDVVVCGCSINHLDYDGPGTVSVQMFPEIHPDRPWKEARLEFFRWPFPAVGYLFYGVFKTNVLRQVPFAVEECLLLMPLSARGRIVALPEALRGYRHHRESMTVSGGDMLCDIRKILWGLGMRLRILKNAVMLRFPLTDKAGLVALALRNLADTNYRWPNDYRTLSKSLETEKRMLLQGRNERRSLVERLRANIEGRQLDTLRAQPDGFEDAAGADALAGMAGIRSRATAWVQSIADWFTRMFLHAPEREKALYLRLKQEVVGLRQECTDLLAEIEELDVRARNSAGGNTGKSAR
jgi:glycosyltransferase involved in cell wall biosynthesis